MNVSANGANLDIADTGSGSAIVLLHGFPLAKEIWDDQVRGLGERARVVRFDSRGLGKSSVPPGPYLMETLAGDVAAVMDALGIERAAIVGHSLGGYVAFAFWRMFAERCTALGFIGSRAGADDAAAEAMRRTLADRAEREGIGPIVEAFVPRYFAPEVYDREPDLVARARSIADATSPQGAAATLRGMAERVAADDLFDEIDVPVHVVAGSRDAFVPVTELARIASGIRGAKLHELDCGHFPMWERPVETASILEEIVAGAVR